MKLNAHLLIVCCILCALCLVNADEFKPGIAFPTNRISNDFSLASFIKQKGPTTDWSLIVLLRGEVHYILNGKVNRDVLADPAAKDDVRQILSEPPAPGDLVLPDEVASSFLNWRRQNKKAEFNVFWKSNPHLLDKALRTTAAASSRASSAPNSNVNDSPEYQTSGASTNPPASVQPPTPQQPISQSPTSSPSKEPTTSTPWSVIVVSIVTATGLLWLLLKRR